jgi:hypothetical protein
LETGWNAGTKGCILVRTGYGAETERAAKERVARAAIVDDIPAAAAWITANARTPANAKEK